MKMVIQPGKTEQNQHRDKKENIKMQAENAMAYIIKLFSPDINKLQDQGQQRQRDKKHLWQAMN